MIFFHVFAAYRHFFALSQAIPHKHYSTRKVKTNSYKQGDADELRVVLFDIVTSKEKHSNIKSARHLASPPRHLCATSKPTQHTNTRTLNQSAPPASPFSHIFQHHHTLFLVFSLKKCHFYTSHNCNLDFTEWGGGNSILLSSSIKNTHFSFIIM